MLVLLPAVLIHPAAGVPKALIAQVQRVMGAIVGQFAPNYGHLVAITQRAALAAAGLEFPHRNPHRDAGVAVVAIGPIGEGAAATKTEPDELAVDARIDQVTGRGHLRACRPIGEVTAGVWRGRVELQRRERKIVEVAHPCSGIGPAVQPAGTAFECIKSRSSRANSRRAIGRAPIDARCSVSC